MSLLKRLLKGNPEDGLVERPEGAEPTVGGLSAPAAPVPDAVAPDTVMNDDGQLRFIARSPRVYLTTLHSLRFAWPGRGGAGPAMIPMVNVSTSGVGFAHEAVPGDLPAVGDEIDGEVLFGDRSVPITLRVARSSHGVLGCQFTGSADELRQAIFAYFRLELAALTMVRVSPKYHKQEPDGPTHWIHGDRGDLYYVESGGGVGRFRLTFLGNHFDGGRDTPLSCGQVVAEDVWDSEAGRKIKGSTLVRDGGLSPEMIELAVKFLGQIPHLPEEHRKDIERYLTRA